MTKRSVGFLALIGIGVGVWFAGCSLESGGTLSLDDDVEDTIPTTESIAPAMEGELSSPDFLKQLDADR